MEIKNPLYTKVTVKTTITERNVVTARIENSQAGVCPKCQQPMGHAALGQCMGNQIVYFCQTCRVAEPLPNI
jgi:predicted  nucleic acid-binding Zn ribbon protein